MVSRTRAAAARSLTLCFSSTSAALARAASFSSCRARHVAGRQPPHVCVWGVCGGVRPVSGKGGEPTWLQLLFVVCAEEEQEGEQRGMRVLCVGNGRARVVRVWRGGVGGVGHALRCLYMPYHLPLSQP